MKQNSKTITKCQISGANDLKSIVFLGYLPPPTKMKKINSKIEEETLYPTVISKMWFAEEERYG